MGKSDELAASVPERTCETCRHVRSRGGNTWADQRCVLYRAGKYAVMTWTAVHDPKKCGSGRSRWQPPATAEELAAVEEQKARVLEEGGPQASLLRHILNGRNDRTPAG